MSRRAVVGESLSREQKNILDMSADLQAVSRLVKKYYREQYPFFEDNVDVLFFFHKKFPMVVELAEMLYPNDEKVKVASSLYDIGRIAEYRLTGGFSANGEYDHHSLGSSIMDRLWLQNGGDITSLTYQQIRNCIKFHGMLGLRVDGCKVDYLELEGASREDIELIEKISTIDSIANGALAPYYLRREQQEHSKSEVLGGFVSKDDQWSKHASDSAIAKFAVGNDFNQKDCRTYADNVLFSAFLVMRNLRAGGEIAEAQTWALEQPCKEILYLNSKGKPAVEGEFFYRRSGGKYITANTLSEIKYKNAIEAYDAIFKASMKPLISKEVREFWKENTKERMTKSLRPSLIGEQREMLQSMGSAVGLPRK